MILFPVVPFSCFHICYHDNILISCEARVNLLIWCDLVDIVNLLPCVSCPTLQNCVYPLIALWLFSDIFFSKTLQQFLLSNKEANLGAGRYQRGRSKVGFNLRSKPQMAALRKPMTRFGGIFLPENSCFCSFGPKMGEYFTFHLTVLITMITRIFV